ncbi:hypothetical protein B0H14DRAFT_1166044 [Mycena olivaceomarginata]|nr:hypothetical protein B0H14DRAFT_1166044 [Mycena olivaceomarginata]
MDSSTPPSRLNSLLSFPSVSPLSLSVSRRTSICYLSPPTTITRRSSFPAHANALPERHLTTIGCCAPRRVPSTPHHHRHHAHGLFLTLRPPSRACAYTCIHIFIHIHLDSHWHPGMDGRTFTFPVYFTSLYCFLLSLSFSCGLSDGGCIVWRGCLRGGSRSKRSKKRRERGRKMRGRGWGGGREREGRGDTPHARLHIGTTNRRNETKR